MLNQRVKVSSSTYLAPPIVNMVQNDSGRVLVCEPFDYQITGSETATLICRRPDGTIFTYTGTVNAADNDVTVPLAAEGGALTQVGDVDAELILTASGSTVTTFKITIRVQEDISGEATPEEKTFVAQLVAEVDASFAEYQAALNDVEEQLDDLVPKTTKVNGKALSSDITLAPSDLGAVPETRKVNNKALNQNITLNAGDVGAVPTRRCLLMPRSRRTMYRSRRPARYLPRMFRQPLKKSVTWSKSGMKLCCTPAPIPRSPPELICSMTAWQIISIWTSTPISAVSTRLGESLLIRDRVILSVS